MIVDLVLAGISTGCFVAAVALYVWSVRHSISHRWWLGLMAFALLTAVIGIVRAVVAGQSVVWLLAGVATGAALGVPMFKVVNRIAKRGTPRW